VKEFLFKFGTGKSFFAAALLSASFCAAAAPTPFGVEIGSATESDLKSKHPNARPTANSIIGLPTFFLDKENSGRMRAVEFSFDEAGKLAVVTAYVYTDHWDEVLAGLRTKYQRSNYVMQKHDVRGGKKYLAPHMDGAGVSQMFEDVFQDGDTIIHAHGMRKQVTFFTLDIHPRLADAAAKSRALRLEKAVKDL